MPYGGAKVFEGRLLDYDAEKVARTVDKLSNDVNSDFFKKNVSEAVQAWLPVSDCARQCSN